MAVSDVRATSELWQCEMMMHMRKVMSALVAGEHVSVYTIRLACIL